MEIKKENFSNHYDDRTDYEITEKGKVKVKEEVFPAFEENSVPDGFLKKARRIVEKFRGMNNKEIVEKVHRELFIDDQNKYYDEMLKSNKRLSDYLEDLDPLFEDYHFCKGLTQALGAIEICYNTTDKLLPSFTKMNGEVIIAPETAGSHHLLSISKDVIKLIQERLKEHLEDHPDRRDEECEKLGEKFHLALFRAELNSKLYNIHIPTLEA